MRAAGVLLVALVALALAGRGIAQIDPAIEETEDAAAPITKLMDDAINGRPLSVAPAPDGGPTIALGNKNRLARAGAGEDDGTEDHSTEERIKRDAEQNKKSTMEQAAKLHLEEAHKARELSRQKENIEQRAKRFDDRLRRKSEQAEKLGHEQMTKQQDTADRQVALAKRAQQREIERIAAREENQKIHESRMEARFKKEMDQARRAGGEAVEKARARQKAELEATAPKKGGNGGGKKDDDGDKKGGKKGGRRGRRNRRNRRGRRNRRRRIISAAKWCDCRNVHVNHALNSWKVCPDTHLMVGIHRNGDQSMNGITHLKCCKPCPVSKRGKRMKVQNCYQENWVSSFDSAGWSRCRDGYYMRGFYKSSCNYIYCLEYAMCCSIKNSKGMHGCGAQNKWASSFDSAGWSIADKHQFINGLYRSGSSHWLYSIEHPMQCKA